MIKEILHYPTSRRELLKMIGVLGSTKLLNLDDYSVKLTKSSLPIKKNLAEFIGYKIAFVTDIHHGPFLPTKWLEEMITLLNSEDFDLLLLGGDYISLPEGFTKRNIYPWHNENFKKSWSNDKIAKIVYEELCSELAKIKATDGTYAVFGNHDAWSSPEVCTDTFQKNKIPFLVNETVQINRNDSVLNIHGTADLWTGFPKLSRESWSSKDLHIILSHNPDFISKELLKEQVPFDYAFCGHTHGGQICLPFVDGIFYNVQDLRFAKGMQVVGDSYVYTSNGVGAVEIPYRLNCPPEVCIFELV